MSDDERSERADVRPFQRSRDDLWEWERKRWSSLVQELELSPGQTPHDSSSSTSQIPTLNRTRSASSLSSFVTHTFFTTQHHRFSRRPSLRPLPSCLKKSKGDLNGFTRLSSGNRSRSSSGEGARGKHVTFQFPDGHREQARPRSLVASMSSAMDFMRNFFRFAFGHQSQTEFASRVRSRRRPGPRRSVDEFDAAALGPSFTRSRHWSDSGSDTSPDLDDYPRRGYI